MALPRVRLAYARATSGRLWNAHLQIEQTSCYPLCLALSTSSPPAKLHRQSYPTYVALPS